MKTLQEVLEQAQRNLQFASDLKDAAKNAVVSGIATTEWRELMSYFSQTPEELDELSNPLTIQDTSLKYRAFTTILTFTSDICPTTLGEAAEGVARSRVAMPSRRAKASTKRKKSTKTKRPAKQTAKTKRSSKKSKKTKRSPR